MTVLEAIILGTLQGLTEFLPISSSGHLVLAQHFLGIEEAGVFFDVMVHLGTLGAVVAVYGRDLSRMAGVLMRALLGSELWTHPVKTVSRSVELRLIFFLFLASIPTGLIGYYFRDLFASAFESVGFVGFMLILTGFVLRVPRLRSQLADAGQLSWWKAVLIGGAQSIAIIPGLSRSGSTISVALLFGIDGATAARFSFLLSIPAILGAGFVQLREVSWVSLNPEAVASGVLASFIVGWAALVFLLALLRRGRFGVFSWYCFGLGAVALATALL